MKNGNAGANGKTIERGNTPFYDAFLLRVAPASFVRANNISKFICCSREINQRDQPANKLFVHANGNRTVTSCTTSVDENID